jgi:SulP family sulfate permease
MRTMPHLTNFDPARWRARAQAYARGAMRDDLVAACVVSVLLIPQSLGYALLAGLPPEAGLYASLLPLLAYAAFGSSPVIGVGPVALLALMLSQAVSHGPAGVPPHAVAIVLAAEVGLLLALAAWWRLHALAALLSVPVLHGFETGAAVAIGLSQLPVLLGSTAHGSSLPQLLVSWRAAQLPWWPLTALYGAVGMVALWMLRRRAAAWLERLMPRGRAALLARLSPLLVLGIAVLIGWLTQAGDRGVVLVGALPALEWRVHAVSFDPSLWQALLPDAVPIALVAFVSSLVVAESMSRREGTRIDPRRELAGLAAANLVAAASAGMPVAGSFTRSVVALDAGSRTRLAGVFTAVFMGVAVLVIGRPLALLPTAVLAATIVVASLAVFDLRPFGEAWRYDRAEAVLMTLVAVLTVVVGVAWALGVGVAASIGLLLQRTARPHVALIGRVPGTEHYRNAERYEVELTPGVMALRIDESLLFTNARQLSDVVAQQLVHYPDTKRVVLQMSPVNHIDLSGLAALRALHDMLGARGIRLDLSEVKGPVLDGLKAGAWQQWFGGQLFLSHHQAMEADALTPTLSQRERE